MTQPLLPSTISTQSPSVEFLTIKTMVRKNHQNNGHTGSSCLDKPVLGQRGGGEWDEGAMTSGFENDSHDGDLMPDSITSAQHVFTPLHCAAAVTVAPFLKVRGCTPPQDTATPS